jgi:F-box protein, helicase, 18
MQLTEQQIQIVNSTGDIKINAVAGSGKTTTIIAFAKSKATTSRILYLAFNKSVKLEAEQKLRMQNMAHVIVETAHSLAFRHIVRQSKYKIKQGDYKPYEVAQILDLIPLGKPMDRYIMAKHIVSMSACFCNSAVAKVSEIDYLETVTDNKAKAFVSLYQSYIEQYVRQFLAKMDRCEIDITHDFYLKKFQLSKPKLNFDFILFDEGQDASPAMLDIFTQQKTIKIIVGDTHQQIYSWRYAVNSLQKIDCTSFDLNNSFRFGDNIASLANEVLKLKLILNEQQQLTPVIGKGTVKTKLSKAIIARTNVGLLMKAITYITDNRKIKHVYFEGNFNSYTYADEGASLYDVLNLYLGKQFLIRDELLKTMASVADLEDYIEKTDDKQLQMMLDIVKEYEEEIPTLLKKIKDKHVTDNEKHKAEIIFSTVHRCKGMEYDVVELANDFINEEKIRAQRNKPDFLMLKGRIEEEINLLYVAVTRAKALLKIPEALLPTNFLVDASIQIIKQPQPPLKTDIVLTDYASRLTHTSKPKTDFNNVKLIGKNQSAYQLWTDDLDNELGSMYDEGLSYQELAIHFGRTKGSIMARLRKIGFIDQFDF